MFKRASQVLKKKHLFFLAGGLMILVGCGFFIFFGLTFLVKNINLVLKPIISENVPPSFHISEAENLFLPEE